MLRKRLLLAFGLLALAAACSSPEEDIRPSINDVELQSLDIPGYVINDPDTTVGNCTQCGNS